MGKKQSKEPERSESSTSSLQSERSSSKMGYNASQAVATFSAKFVNELYKDESVVSSPLSAEFVLALLTLGAKEPAHSELLTALGIPHEDNIRTTFSTMSAKIKSVKGVTLKVANKVYLKDGSYELEPKLKKDAVSIFDAALEKVDFNKAAEAVKLINSWVESKTNNKIKDLLSPDCIDGATRLVLVNAIYFKGSWKKKFDAKKTTEQPFHVNKSTKKNVPMMFQESKFAYGESEDLNAQLLEMPYVGNETSLVIVLPKDIEGLNKILSKLADGYNLLDDLERMNPEAKVRVSLPKFKIETEIDLTELLPKLGIVDIFDSGCMSLTKILKSNEPLFVSKAVQKAFIEVNEEGAEAAAATGAVVMLRCAMMPDLALEFNANHPFLYLLMGQDRTIAFIGAFCGK